MTRNVTRCWVVRDADGKPWHDDWDNHEPDRESAEVTISDMRDEYGDETALAEFEEGERTYGPGDLAAAAAFADAQVTNQRLGGLVAVELGEDCVHVTCDGPCGDRGPNCQPVDPTILRDGDTESIVHFPSDQVANGIAEHEWTTDGVRDHCPDCPSLKPAGPSSGTIPGDQPLPLEIS